MDLKLYENILNIINENTLEYIGGSEELTNKIIAYYYEYECSLEYAFEEIYIHKMNTQPLDYNKIINVKEEISKL